MVTGWGDGFLATSLLTDRLELSILTSHFPAEKSARQDLAGGCSVAAKAENLPTTTWAHSYAPGRGGGSAPRRSSAESAGCPSSLVGPAWGEAGHKPGESAAML